MRICFSHCHYLAEMFPLLQDLCGCGAAAPGLEARHEGLGLRRQKHVRPFCNRRVALLILKTMPVHLKHREIWHIFTNLDGQVQVHLKLFLPVTLSELIPAWGFSSTVRVI